VLERIDRIRRYAVLKYELGSNEPGERGLQLVLGKTGDGKQRGIAEPTPERRPDLRHMPHRRQTVEPRRQRGVQTQTRRDREWRQRAIEHVLIHFLAQQIALQDTFGQLLDEQRHAVGALDDLGDDLIRQRLAAGDLRHQSGPVMPIQAIEDQHRHMRLAGPRRLELGAERYDQ